MFVLGIKGAAHRNMHSNKLKLNKYLKLYIIGTANHKLSSQTKIKEYFILISSIKYLFLRYVG